MTDKSQPIVVYCAGGTRSALAAKTLQDLGYTDVCSMRGGFNEWKNNGMPFVTPEKVGKDQMGRYSRHVRIPSRRNAAGSSTGFTWTRQPWRTIFPM